MTRPWRTLVCAALLSVSIAWSHEANGPIGLWRSLDDRTGATRALIRISERGGILYGRVETIVDPRDAAAVCDKCAGDRHGKKLKGLEIIRGLRPDGHGAWNDGEILDPETGDTYRASLRIIDGGRKLVLRGSILGGLIGGSQTWLRADPD